MAIVHLHGDMRTQFGGPFNIDVADAKEAVRALCNMIKGFRRRMGEGNFRVIRGRGKCAKPLSQDMLDISVQHSELHITPVIEGRGRGGKAILGVVLIAAAFYFAPAVVGAAGPTLGMGAEAFSIMGSSISFGQIALFGASMVLSGISQLLSPTPSAPSSTESADQRASFIFTGAVNTIEQGNAWKLVFGEFRCGSVVVASALTTEQI